MSSGLPRVFVELFALWFFSLAHSGLPFSSPPPESEKTFLFFCPKKGSPTGFLVVSPPPIFISPFPFKEVRQFFGDEVGFLLFFRRNRPFDTVFVP